MHYVPAGEFQGKIRRVNPGDFTRIFVRELAIHTDRACIADGKPGQQVIALHQRAAKRDILDRGRVILIIQFQQTYLFGNKSFM